jgi:hypothetical protein
MDVQDNKIPNLKRQITKKFQIPIFNDQNIHHSSIASLRKPGSAGDDTVGHGRKRINCLEFCIWVIGICLIFGFWCLEFS